MPRAVPRAAAPTGARTRATPRAAAPTGARTRAAPKPAPPARPGPTAARWTARATTSTIADPASLQRPSAGALLRLGARLLAFPVKSIEESLAAEIGYIGLQRGIFGSDLQRVHQGGSRRTRCLSHLRTSMDCRRPRPRRVSLP